MENTIPSTELLAECNSGADVSNKPMSRQRVALSRWLHIARKHWRPFLLGVLIVFVAVAVCGLYLQGSDRAEHAAIVIGWTFIGMLGLASWVCRR